MKLITKKEVKTIQKLWNVNQKQIIMIFSDRKTEITKDSIEVINFSASVKCSELNIPSFVHSYIISGDVIRFSIKSYEIVEVISAYPYAVKETVSAKIAYVIESNQPKQTNWDGKKFSDKQLKMYFNNFHAIQIISNWFLGAYAQHADGRDITIKTLKQSEFKQMLADGTAAE